VATNCIVSKCVECSQTFVKKIGSFSARMIFSSTNALERNRMKISTDFPVLKNNNISLLFVEEKILFGLRMHRSMVRELYFCFVYNSTRCWDIFIWPSEGLVALGIMEACLKVPLNPSEPYCFDVREFHAGP